MKTTFDTEVGKITCYNNDHYFFNSLLTKNPYELRMINSYLRSFVKNSKNIIDIGSHIGFHSIAYSKMNPSANILAFEPQGMVFKLLVENLEANSIKNVKPFNMAVSNKSGRFNLSSVIADGNNANTPIEYGTEKEFNLGGVSLGKDGEEVITITIDLLGLDNIDFIKIDVEGAESLVVLGGINTIAKYKPVVCYESNSKTVTQDMREMFGCYDMRTTKEILRDIGYKTFAKITNDNIIAIYD